MKKFDNYISNLAVLSRAYEEDLENDFIEEKTWLGMLRTRNDMTHIYDAEAARALVNEILRIYIPAFEHLKNKIVECYGEELNRL